jgi:hypothetical protein
MDERTLTALKGSIEKWKRIVAHTGIDKGPTNCPLCQLFYADNCAGCPVAEAAGEIMCGGTPYEDWSKAIDVWSGDSEWASMAAHKEVDFLRSLLPRGKE